MIGFMSDNLQYYYCYYYKVLQNMVINIQVSESEWLEYCQSQPSLTSYCHQLVSTGLWEEYWEFTQRRTKKQNHGVSEKLYIICLWTVIYHTFSPRPKAKAKAKIKIKTKTKKTTNSKSKSKSHWEGWPEHKHFAPKTKRETEPLRIIFWTKKLLFLTIQTQLVSDKNFLLQNTNIAIGLQIQQN